MNLKTHSIGFGLSSPSPTPGSGPATELSVADGTTNRPLFLLVEEEILFLLWAPQTLWPIRGGWGQHVAAAARRMIPAGHLLLDLVVGFNLGQGYLGSLDSDDIDDVIVIDGGWASSMIIIKR